ncbi:hypothetical protein ACIBJI_23660 [Nocardia sp. NPDC050408]
MWVEIGKTIRQAISDWGTTARLAVCVTVITVAAVAIIGTSTLH